MDINEYVRQSSRTEKDISELVIFGHRNALLKKLLEKVATDSGAVDELKKNIIYGKVLDDDEFCKKYHINEHSLGLKKQITLDSETARMLHGIVGIAGEAGELAEHLIDNLYQGAKYDRTKVAEELGDLMWYVALVLRVLNVDAEQLLQANIDKLKARYPEKYTAENALHRDTNVEQIAVKSALD